MAKNRAKSLHDAVALFRGSSALYSDFVRLCVTQSHTKSRRDEKSHKVAQSHTKSLYVRKLGGVRWVEYGVMRLLERMQ